MHKELLRELERFKAEEMARMDRKLEDSRDGMRREMEFLYNRNIQALSVRGTKPLRSLLLRFTTSFQFEIFFKLTRSFLFTGSESESDGQAGQTKQPCQLSGTTRRLQRHAAASHPQAGAADEETGEQPERKERPLELRGVQTFRAEIFQRPKLASSLQSKTPT